MKATTHDGANRGGNGQEIPTVGSTHGHRFTPEERERALALVAQGKSKKEAAAAIGASAETVRIWSLAVDERRRREAKVGATKATQPATATQVKRPSRPRSPYAPTDPGQGLADYEVKAIVELKRENPSMGPAQLRAQLKRFKGWRLSIKAIARVLKAHGFPKVHRGSRPEGPEPIRFEAPRRDALWQADYAEVRVGPEKLYLLVGLDDFSRFIVGHALVDTPSSDAAVATLKAAIARHGKPEAMRTDRGGAFVAFSKATDFGRYLEAELIDHVVGRSYHPQGGGKVEAVIKTIRRELWDIEEFPDRETAAWRLAEWVEAYNTKRAHMGIDGLTPADRYFGRADRVLEAVNAVSRRRQGASWGTSGPGGPVEEMTDAGQPLEVLRLMLVNGRVELRFCGARVALGQVTS